MPLLLIHGWPSSPVEYLGMIESLRDAYHLVIPSIPGFGLSGPTTEAGWGRDRVAAAFAELMTRLGYERFAVHGGDFGALIARELGLRHPDRVLGAHVLQVFAFPSGDPEEMARLTPEDYGKLEHLGRWNREFSGYTEIQSRRPQTLAFGLADSPVGLLAWVLDMFDGYGDNVDGVARDALLTNLTIYWVTGTIASSMRFYYDDAQAGAWEQEEAGTVPTGVAVFPRDFRSIRPFAERANRIVHWTRARARRPLRRDRGPRRARRGPPRVPGRRWRRRRAQAAGGPGSDPPQSSGSSTKTSTPSPLTGSTWDMNESTRRPGQALDRGAERLLHRGLERRAHVADGVRRGRRRPACAPRRSGRRAGR